MVQATQINRKRYHEIENPTSADLWAAGPISSTDYAKSIHAILQENKGKLNLDEPLQPLVTNEKLTKLREEIA